MASGGQLIRSQHFDVPSDAPKYLKDALRDIGIQEWVMNGGRKVSNPVVQRYVAKALGKESWNGSTITTPWCAYWVGAKLEYASITGSRSGMARSYLKWGVAVEEDSWQVGDIVVLMRGRVDDGVVGHIGFLLFWDETHVYLVGGNQGDKVSIQGFERERMLGVRRPRGVWQSKTIQANGGAISNEVAVKPAVDALIPSKAQMIADGAEQIKGPLEMLAQYKPWIMGVLTCITVGLVLYGLYCRYSDHASGRNT